MAEATVTEVEPMMDPGAMAIVTRQFWNAAQPAHKPRTLFHPVKHVWFIYNIGTPCCKTKDECKTIVKLLQQRCISGMKMSDIPFNFLIGGDGRIYEGRGWFHQPPGFRNHPDEGGDRIDIGYVQSRDKNHLSYQMTKATLDLVSLGIRQKYIAEGYKTKEWNKIGEPIEDDPNKPFG